MNRPIRLVAAPAILAAVVACTGFGTSDSRHGPAAPATPEPEAGDLLVPQDVPTAMDMAESLLSDGDFTGAHEAWRAPAEGVRFIAEDADGPARAELGPTAQISQLLITDPERVGSTFLLSAHVRAPADAGRLRLQVAWLPEGGWNAKDAQGNSLVEVQAERVELKGDTWQTFSIEADQSAQATRAVVYLINDGASPFEVSNVTFTPH